MKSQTLFVLCVAGAIVWLELPKKTSSGSERTITAPPCPSAARIIGQTRII